MKTVISEQEITEAAADEIKQAIAGKTRASELSEDELDRIIDLTGDLPNIGGHLSFVQKCNIVAGRTGLTGHPGYPPWPNARCVDAR